jgi:Kef-type K+ transport system membrane component KefB
MGHESYHVPVVVWVSAAAALAPWLADRLRFLGLPVVALELLLGMGLGPQGLGLASVSEALPYLSRMGTATLFLLAGMEIDLKRLHGTPLRRGLASWLLSLAIGTMFAYGLFAAGWISSWVVVAMALATTSLGVLSPILRDTGVADTPLGQCVTACGFTGEMGPIIVASVVFAASGGQLKQSGLTLAFIVLAIVLCWASMWVRPPRVIALLARTMNGSGQWPIRVCLLLLAVLVALAESLGLDLALGAFAAGLAIGLATRESDSELLHQKLDAIGFGFLVPAFFIVSGMKLDLGALIAHPSSVGMVALLVVGLLVTRGITALLFRSLFPLREVAVLGLYSATSLSLIVVFTNVASESGQLAPEEAVALVAAGLVSVMVFPRLASKLLGQGGGPRNFAGTDRDAL